ncbi:MAG: 4Fe-4S ferredoxin, partial [gamma proteobacterium symbiont of Ctena orbiculata]
MSVRKKETKRNKPTLTPRRREQSRREFLRATVLTAGVVGVSLLGFVPVIQGKAMRLRPP